MTTAVSTPWAGRCSTPMYHHGWAWAGDSPFQSTKLVAGHFGGTRTPLVISWPARIAPDKTPRGQFHHVNDIAPTIYEILGITPPHIFNGVEQMPFDGVSMVYTFDDARGEGTQDDPVLRPRHEPGDLPRRLVRSGAGPAQALGAGPARRADLGIRTTTHGNSTTSPRTTPRPTTWPRRCRTDCARCRTSSRWRPAATTSSRSAAASTPRCSRRRSSRPAR